MQAIQISHHLQEKLSSLSAKTRIDAYLVEEALFFATLPSKEYPSKLENWVGKSERRKSDRGMKFHSNHQESLRLNTMAEINYWLMKKEPY